VVPPVTFVVREFKGVFFTRNRRLVDRITFRPNNNSLAGGTTWGKYATYPKLATCYLYLGLRLDDVRNWFAVGVVW